MATQQPTFQPQQLTFQPQQSDNFSIVPSNATPWNKYPLNTASQDQVYQCGQENGTFLGYDLNRLTFTEPKLEPVKSDDGKAMPAYRIQIKDRRPDGKLQNLVFRLKEAYCFGVNPSTDMKDKNLLTGYQIGYAMWSRDGATEDEKYITDLIEYWIVDRVLDHLMKIKDTVLLGDKDKRDLRNTKVFSRGKDKASGKIKKDDPPIWNPKLFVTKTGKPPVQTISIRTKFYWKDVIDADGAPAEVDPMVFLKKGFKATPSIILESIYISAKGEVFIMSKVHEVDCQPAGDFLPRLGKVSENAVPVDQVLSDPKYAAYLTAKKSLLAITPPPPIGVSTSTENPLLSSVPLTTGNVGPAGNVAPIGNTEPPKTEFSAPPLMMNLPPSVPGMPSGPQVPSIPQVPGMPSVPQLPSVPSMPQLPVMPPKVTALNPSMVPPPNR